MLSRFRLSHSAHPFVGYLTREQIRASLARRMAQPTSACAWTRVLLMLMYNTGASGFGDRRLAYRRSSLGIRWFGSRPWQKGKQRLCKCSKLLRQWLKNRDRSPEKPLLPNCLRGGVMTRAGVTAYSAPSGRRTARGTILLKCRISPHSIRHTTAMHLLQSGVDLLLQGGWGHESIQTTDQYLQADLESKKKALATIKSPCVPRLWRCKSLRRGV